MASDKLDQLCVVLEATPNVGPYVKRAAFLLRAYDALAEFAAHAPDCPASPEPNPMDAQPTNCTCGLSAAQKVVADLIDAI